MSTQQISLEVPSKKGENIFDKYYNLIEEARLEENDNEMLDHIEQGNPRHELLVKALIILERNFDDIASLNDDKSLLTKVRLSVCLEEWLPIFALLLKEIDFINHFSCRILGLAIIVAQSSKLTSKEIIKDILFFYPNRKATYFEERIKNLKSHTSVHTLSSLIKCDFEYLRNSVYEKPSQEFRKYGLASILNRLSKIMFAIFKSPFSDDLNPYFWDEYTKVRNEASDDFTLLLLYNIYPEYKQKKIRSVVGFDFENKLKQYEIEEYRERLNSSDLHSVLEKLRNDENFEYRWNIEVTIHGDGNYKADQIGFLMWAISDALQSLDDVEVFLEDWGNGSKRFNLKVIIKDFLAKTELKQILDKSRKAVEAKHLEKPIAEAEKLKAEKEKIAKEIENIVSKEKAEKLHDLDIERKQLELQEKEVDIMDKAANVALKRLQLVKGYSELIKEGILKNDSDFQIMINDLLYLKKENGIITSGEDIEIIEENEIRNLKPDTNKE